MRKFRHEFVLLLVSIALGCIAGASEYDEIFHGRRKIPTGSKIFSKNRTPMHKALFTQRGYIQFLRWELPVPEIEEFTFCLWVKSTNLTYSHSIFSYSKNEEKRLVRSWISPFGRSIHLEIGEKEIMAHPTHLEEHRWYHICQSWENRIGHYALWIDGQKQIEGFATELIGHVIPSKGDMVVGQEYTDFDKGFEEGIEGAVLGFNFVLSSAFDRSDNFPPGPIGLHPAGGILLRRSGEDHPEFKPQLRNQGVKILNERMEGMFDSTLNEYLGGERFFGRNIPGIKFVHKSKRDTRSPGRIRRTRNRGNIPLGLQLVDLSFNHCQLGRGSPFIGGSKMLISWTRTPVKVFGGAILKDAKSNCGNF